MYVYVYVYVYVHVHVYVYVYVHGHIYIYIYESISQVCKWFKETQLQEVNRHFMITCLYWLALFDAESFNVGLSY